MHCADDLGGHYQTQGNSHMFLVEGVFIHFVAGNDLKCSSFVIEQSSQLISLSAKQKEML
jgi:hypothetical protein